MPRGPRSDKEGATTQLSSYASLFVKCCHVSFEQIACPRYGCFNNKAGELYRPSDRRLTAKLMPTFAEKWSHVVSATDPHGR
jgi:hypothetical protein